MKKPELNVLEESLKSCGTTLFPADTILLFRCSRVGLRQSVFNAPGRGKRWKRIQFKQSAKISPKSVRVYETGQDESWRYGVMLFKMGTEHKFYNAGVPLVQPHSHTCIKRNEKAPLAPANCTFDEAAGQDGDGPDGASPYGSTISAAAVAESNLKWQWLRHPGVDMPVKWCRSSRQLIFDSTVHASIWFGPVILNGNAKRVPSLEVPVYVVQGSETNLGQTPDTDNVEGADPDMFAPTVLPAACIEIVDHNAAVMDLHMDEWLPLSQTETPISLSSVALQVDFNYSSPAILSSAAPRVSCEQSAQILSALPRAQIEIKKGGGGFGGGFVGGFGGMDDDDDMLGNLCPAPAPAPVCALPLPVEKRTHGAVDGTYSWNEVAPPPRNVKQRTGGPDEDEEEEDVHDPDLPAANYRSHDLDWSTKRMRRGYIDY